MAHVSDEDESEGDTGAQMAVTRRWSDFWLGEIADQQAPHSPVLRTCTRIWKSSGCLKSVCPRQGYATVPLRNEGRIYSSSGWGAYVYPRSGAATSFKSSNPWRGMHPNIKDLSSGPPWCGGREAASSEQQKSSFTEPQMPHMLLRYNTKDTGVCGSSHIRISHCNPPPMLRGGVDSTTWGGPRFRSFRPRSIRPSARVVYYSSRTSRV